MKDKAADRRGVRTYVIGFILSIILTLLAFGIVMNNTYNTHLTVGIIISLAVIQLFVQLFFFLHLGQAAQRRWRLVALGFGVLVVAIIVFGSLWIMDNLNYNMMHSPEDMKHYIDKQAGF